MNEEFRPTGPSFAYAKIPLNPPLQKGEEVGVPWAWMLIKFLIPHPLVVAKRKSRLRGDGVVDIIIESLLAIV